MNVVLVPPHSKNYRIVHVDRLLSIMAEDFLWRDAEIVRRAPASTTNGMNSIKYRRLKQDSVERQVFGWNACKRQFTPRQLAVAEERLRSQGWLLPEMASAH